LARIPHCKKSKNPVTAIKTPGRARGLQGCESIADFRLPIADSEQKIQELANINKSAIGNRKSATTKAVTNSAEPVSSFV
jgi:hypothetical protein